MIRRTVVVLAAALAAGGGARAYTPGTGSLASESFQDAVADGWTTENTTSSSAWIVVPTHGGNLVWDADGQGSGASAPTLHLATRPVFPVPAASFSTAFAWRADGGANFLFRVDVEQRAPAVRAYRLEIDAAGAMSIRRARGGPYTVLAQTAPSFVRFRQDRWIRFSLEEQGGQLHVRARMWSGAADREPDTWDLSAADPAPAVERVHRMTVSNEGPRGAHTQLDDLEIWGDRTQGVVSSVRTIYVCEWSHLDIGFTTTPQAIELWSKTHLDQVLDNLDADPVYRWTIESYWMLQEWLERSSESQKQRMYAALRSGRVRLAAGYANLSIGTVGHEELARHLYPSLDLARREGFRVRTYIQDDVPSSSYALPEMLSSTGIEFYIGGMNTAFGGRLVHPSMAERPFWWQGPDGARVLAWHSFDGYAEAWDYGFGWFDSLAVMEDELAAKLPEVEEQGYPHDTLMIMRAFDNNYTGQWTRQRVDAWNAAHATPRFVLAHPEEFLDLMKARLGETIPVFTGDYGPGWSAAAGDHEMRQVREARRDTRSAEALGALADVVGVGPDPRPAIGRAWNLILTLDEHSGAGGWPGTFNQQEMLDSIAYYQALAADAEATAQGALDGAADALASAVPAPGRDALVVVNGLPLERDAWPRVGLPADLDGAALSLWDRAAGVEIPFQWDASRREILFRAQGVPPLGYRVYDLRPGPPAAMLPGMLSVQGNVLENDLYRVTVDPSDGAISSLWWKPGQVEMVDGSSAYRFNRLGRSTHSEVFFGSAPTAEPGGTPTVTVGEAGPLAASLVVTRATTPHVRAEIRLYRGDDRVDLLNTLDRSRMPVVLEGDTHTYGLGLPFDIHAFQIRSDRTNRFFDPVADNFPRSTFFVYHDAEHALDFWDDTSGVTSACADTPTHDFQAMGTAGGTIPRTDALLWSRLATRNDEFQYDDGEYGPVDWEPGVDPVATYRHVLRAHAPGHDPASANRFGFDVLSPLPVRVVRDQEGSLPPDAASFLSADDPTVSWYTVKREERGPGLVLRMAELTGQARTVRIFSDLLALSSPRLLSFVEEEAAPLAMDGADGFLVPLAPYQTVTVGVDAAFPVTLRADKDVEGGAVHLAWLGGPGPFTVERASRPDFADAAVLASGVEGNAFDDPVLEDGATWYYRVRP